jgi:flagellar motor switch protein FliG
MTRLQKLAQLLVLLGDETATSLLQSFDADDAEAILNEVAHLQSINVAQQNAILNEFTESALQANAAIGGSVKYMRFVLERALGLEMSFQIVGRLAQQCRVAGPSIPSKESITTQAIRMIVDSARSARSRISPASEHAPEEPARIAIEVLKQLTREDPSKISVAARFWTDGKQLDVPVDLPKTAFSANQKLAAILIMLGEEVASMILGQFDNAECERVAWDLSMLPTMNLEQQTAILKDFTELALRDAEEEIAQATAEEQTARRIVEAGVAQDRKAELFTDVGLGQRSPERITIEVLKQLTHENVTRMSRVARSWATQG